MSKPRKSNIAVLLTCAGFLLFPRFTLAQYIEAAIKLDPEKRSASVEGKFISGERRSLSFLLSAIGAPDLGQRISNVRLSDRTGSTVGSRRTSSAEFAADSAIAKFRYDVDIKPVSDARSAAHASWLDGELGLLMLDDLLPIPGSPNEQRAALKIELPTGWHLYGGSPSGRGFYEFENVGRAAIFVGKSVRFHRNNGKELIGLAVAGTWSFPDAEAAGMAAEIYREYRSLFGVDTTKDRLVVLLPFPQANVPKGTWEAETRGSTVIIASAEMPFKSQSLQRLHEQLRHEVFHLWLPNGVNLTGRYDWFYEGLALYQSLKTGVALNRIRFDDMLDTLSRAHNIDSAQARKLSLIDASATRWAGQETQVYARGMIIAFLCDLILLRDSTGKRSAEDLFRKLFADHRPPAVPVEGNQAILRILDSYPALGPVVRAYVRGNERFDWTAELAAAGIVNEAPSGLQVASKLTGKQKTLLDKLGYNNWRKLTQK